MINASLAETWRKDGWWDTVDWKEFQKYWPLATMDEKPDNSYGIQGPCRLSYEEANALAAMGVKLDINPLPGAMITKMKDDPIKQWEHGTRIEGADLINGSAVQITVPDMALLYINTVRVETDLCTDVLQDLLDEGWRIIAVCPPNSQRRPDYILGKYTKGEVKMKVYVVMGNDFPDAVFSSEEKAKEYCAKKRRDDDPHTIGRRVFWRICGFELDARDV